jgi:hypothetical protein
MRERAALDGEEKMSKSRWRDQYMARRQAAWSDERETWRIAVHEASHAVLAYISGNVRLRHIVVGRNSEGLGGLCAWENCNNPRALIVVALAGPASDTIFFNRSRSDDTSDYRDAYRYAERIVAAESGDVHTIIGRARAAAEALVKQHFVAIATLAGELMRSGQKLNGEQVERILAENRVPRDTGGDVQYRTDAYVDGRRATNAIA